MKAIRTAEIQVTNKGLSDKIPVIQSDSGRSIDFIISDMTMPSGATARIYARKPDLTEVYNSCSINDNTVTVDLTTQMLAVVGEVKCQIQIISASDIVTTFEFALVVEKSLVSDTAIESTNEFGTLTDAMKQISEFYATMSELEAKINAINVGVTGVKGNGESSYRSEQVNLTLANLGYSAANNLTTTATNYLLDARQGKALDEKIADVVRVVTHSFSVTIPAGSGVTNTVDVSAVIPSGYKMLYPIGAQSGSNVAYFYSCVYDSMTTIIYQIKNTNTSAITVTPTIAILVIRS